MTTFERIKYLAKNKGLSLQKVAELSHIGINTIYKWKNYDPKGTDLAEVAKTLNTTTDYLLARTDDPVVPISDSDLDKMLDNARSFDGKPMSEHDREIIKSYLKGYYQSK